MLLVSLLLKAATDGEFLLSSGNPFQIRVTEGRNECIYRVGFYSKFSNTRIYLHKSINRCYYR